VSIHLAELRTRSSCITAEHVAGRRAPATTHSSKGRLPRGTIRQSDSLPQPHIQIVPRDETDFTLNDSFTEDNDIPTFNSPSLQSSLLTGDKPRYPGHTTGELPAKIATFADMARRFHTADNKAELELPTHGSATSAGIIRLQPTRNKGDKFWWALQTTDVAESGHASSDDSSAFDRLHHSDDRIDESLPRNTSTATPSSKSSPLELLHQRSTLPNHTSFLRRPEDLQLRAAEGSGSIGGLQSTPDEHYSQLFGKLPDPIHLQEQMGEFDGQVTFITHPNRDVSAHQWSSSSFQWENIGRYSYSRGKVEGSLASDRLQAVDASCDSLQYFKLAAEAREKQIIDYGRPKECYLATSGVASADTNRVASLSSFSGMATRGSTGIHDSDTLSLPSPTRPSTPPKFQKLLKGSHLEDPFVAPTISPKLEAASNFYRGTDVGKKGLLDFAFQFPDKSGKLKASASLLATGVWIDDQLWREAGRPNSTCSDSNPTSNLREVGFGEEAACGFPEKNTCNSIASTASIYSFFETHLSSFENHKSRQNLRNKLIEFGEQITQAQETVQKRITIPALASVQPSARSLFPSPGLTVANPHRVPSNLNATAPPYVSKLTPSPASEVTVSETTTSNATTSVGIHSGGPESLRRARDYEVANGLGQQAPTKQTFTGPFFTDSKPSTHNPTAALSIQVDEEEKLVNWFRDGQRPSRQREYANTLVSSAAAKNRSRHFGAIGERMSKPKQHAHEHTGLFVRLYENMSEYAEESRSGNSRAYFTRAWKPATRQQRAPGLNDDNSYFDQSLAFSAQTRRTSYMEPNERSWGGLGLTANLTRARFPHGTPIGTSRGERGRVNVF
jgi:hypothetical protein